MEWWRYEKGLVERYKAMNSNTEHWTQNTEQKRRRGLIGKERKDARPPKGRGRLCVSTFPRTRNAKRQTPNSKRQTQK